MKRVAVLLPGGIGGGYFNQGIPVISRLLEDLNSHFIISVYSQSPPNPDFHSALKIHSPSRKIKSSRFRWLILFWWLIRDRTKYEVLYAFWGFPGGMIVSFLAALLRKRSIIHVQGGDCVYLPSIGYGSFFGWRKTMLKWSYQHCDELIALTKFQKRILESGGIKRQIEIIPFGVDPQLFFRAERSSGDKSLSILHVGNLVPVKNQRALLELFAVIHKQLDSHLTIIGEDHLQHALQEYCTALKLEKDVTFIPILPYEGMVKWYHQADVIVQTSWYEGQGLAITEAAQCGVLIAGTKTGILSDWGEDCFIELSNDPDKDAQGIIKVWRDTKQKNAFVECALQKVATRSWTAQQIIDLLNREE